MFDEEILFTKMKKKKSLFEFIPAWLTKVKKERLIKWVCNVWYNEGYIKKETIKKSFLMQEYLKRVMGQKMFILFGKPNSLFFEVGSVFTVLTGILMVYLKK